MSEQVLDIIIDWETLQITAHLDGEADAMKCKEEILAFLEDIGAFMEGRWTIEFKRSDDDPNARQRMGSMQRQKDLN